MAKGFDWQSVKARTRRVVHNTFGGDAKYMDSTQPEIALTVRWHNKIQVGGDLESGGYAETIEGIERVIFDREELMAKGVTLRNNGTVIMADGTVLTLGTQEPIVGPIEVIWQVARG
jgi:hypothetical protein